MIYRHKRNLFISITCLFFISALLSIGCDNENSLLLDASKAFESKDYDLAKENYLKALDNDINHLSVYTNLGYIYQYVDNKLDAAENIYLRGLTIYPESVTLKHNLMNIFIEKKKFNGAIELYKEIYTLNPGNNISFNAAAFDEYDGDSEDIIRMLTELLSVNPKNYAFHFKLGEIYKNEKKYDNALEHYLLAVKYRPDYKFAYLGLGTIYYQLGEKENKE